jgi:hypothetical protein
MRYIYVSTKGGKPLNIGINRAKRVARSADRRDQAAVVGSFGGGLPRQHIHHQELVRARHRYYHEQQDEFVKAHPPVQQMNTQGAREMARRRRRAQYFRSFGNG